VLRFSVSNQPNTKTSHLQISTTNNHEEQNFLPYIVTHAADPVRFAISDPGALNHAVKRVGMDEFNNLDRSQLVMISTLEPCEMCRGAMLHYRVYHTRFMKDKPFGRWLRSHMRSIRYEPGKRKADGEAIQDSLFWLHPEYDTE
jgi:hypothetical protein